MDKTATAASQVAALFGAATPASFSVSGESVSWIGASRLMVPLPTRLAQSMACCSSNELETAVADFRAVVRAERVRAARVHDGELAAFLRED